MNDPEKFALVTPGLQEILSFAGDLLTPDSVEEARKQAQSLSLKLAEKMEGFDALLSPTVAGQTPVSEKSGTIDGEETSAWVSYTYGFNVTRRPAGTTNAGFTAAGMPVGLQIVGHQLDDLGVLQTTAWIEDLLGFDPIAPL
jgi:aspartyl-tRNA(Asn)/glutamyl-tRNA(Gln) amidotransferase subunit A